VPERAGFEVAIQEMNYELAKKILREGIGEPSHRDD
tara:strand:- start:609 stop:716 length:108 start_codon:yes stop_codon:yes gene_type:complete